MGSGVDSEQQTAARARVLVVDDSPTIRKVVRLILARHGFEAVGAGDGVEAMARLSSEGPFDLVLLDFVMPRMNGYRFCRELRAHAVHADLPVVLMSARSDAIRDRFVEQTGALDALGKPFDGRALVAVVESVLAKTAGGAAGRSAPAPEAMLPEEELTAAGPASLRGLARSTELAGVLAAQLAPVLAPAIKELRPSLRAKEESLRQVLATVLDEDRLGALAAAVEDLGAAQDKKIMLRGSLSGMPLAELLQMLQLGRRTAVLRATHGRSEMTIWIRDGLVDFVQSRGTREEFRLGRYFIEQGLLTREQLQAALDKTGTGKLLGELLVEAGHVTAEQLAAALEKQSRELVYEVVRWQEGAFSLTDEPFSPQARKAALGLATTELVLEGFRRVDEWRVMERTVDFNAVPEVNTAALGTLDQGKLGQAEARLLAAIDGKRTVREVMVESAVSSFDAIRILYQFMESRLVRTRG
ncbi:MAG: response regulator [Deltaproteobacteria bacterium]|nr:response regulator [Deltaproteobacteria bacterium]